MMHRQWVALAAASLFLLSACALAPKGSYSSRQPTSDQSGGQETGGGEAGNGGDARKMRFHTALMALGQRLSEVGSADVDACLSQSQGMLRVGMDRDYRLTLRCGPSGVLGDESIRIELEPQ